MSLFVCFHFFFLLLSVSSVRRLWLDLIAIQMRSPCRLSTGLAIFKFFVGGTFRLRHCTMIIESVPLPRRGKPRLYGEVSRQPPVFAGVLLKYRVRHRFRATFSRQPRQVRKEATVTGSFVCSGAPVPGFLFALLSVERRASSLFRQRGGRAGTPGSPLANLPCDFRHD